jgi:hypothetical protein
LNVGSRKTIHPGKRETDFSAIRVTPQLIFVLAKVAKANTLCRQERSTKICSFRTIWNEDQAELNIYLPRHVTVCVVA